MSQRNYKYKDVIMLMAAKAVLNSMLDNLGTLGMVRTNWTEAYVTDLIERIENDIEIYLGLDKKQPLRDATAVLNAIVSPAMFDLALVKIQIEVDFDKKAIEIKKELGINEKLGENDQEDLIETLYAFKKGMTPALKTQVTAKGTNPELIDRIIGYASQLQQANLAQEGQKGTTKEVSQEAVDAFNAVYSEVIGICKIASKVFKDKPLKKDLFSFTKVARKMGVAKEKPEEPVEG
jgi:hypothetical protein